jgi:hypothetical protein
MEITSLLFLSNIVAYLGLFSSACLSRVNRDSFGITNIRRATIAPSNSFPHMRHSFNPNSHSPGTFGGRNMSAMGFEPHLHWSFNDEHILLPSLVLHSFGSFLAACIVVVVICISERFVAIITFIHGGLFLSTETRYCLDCSLSYSTRNGFRVNLDGLEYLLLYGEQGCIL